MRPFELETDLTVRYTMTRDETEPRERAKPPLPPLRRSGLGLGQLADCCEARRAESVGPHALTDAPTELRFPGSWSRANASASARGSRFLDWIEWYLRVSEDLTAHGSRLAARGCEVITVQGFL